MQVTARVIPGHTWAVSAGLVRGQAGFATELWAEDDPSLSGEAGIAAAPVDPLGKPTATCFSSTALFPVPSSLSMSVNTTQSSLLGCCGCSVPGRDVCGGTTQLFRGGSGALCLSFPVDNHSQYLVLVGDQSSLNLHPPDLKSTIQGLDWMISRRHFNPDKSGILPSG